MHILLCLYRLDLWLYVQPQMHFQSRFPSEKIPTKSPSWDSFSTNTDKWKQVDLWPPALSFKAILGSHEIWILRDLDCTYCTCQNGQREFIVCIQFFQTVNTDICFALNIYYLACYVSELLCGSFPKPSIQDYSSRK